MGYLVLFRWQCTYNAGHRHETCGSTVNTVVPDPSPLFRNVIEKIGADFVKVATFDPARLSAAISTDVSKLSRDDTNRMISPDAMQLHAPVMTDLLKATGLSKP